MHQNNQNVNPFTAVNNTQPGLVSIFACKSLLRRQALQKRQICVKKIEVFNMSAVALKQALND